MIDIDEYEKGFNEYPVSDYWPQTKRIQAHGMRLLKEVKRLRKIEQEWLMMWATLEELNLVADVRKNMTEHGFTFPTDEEASA